MLLSHSLPGGCLQFFVINMLEQRPEKFICLFTTSQLAIYNNIVTFAVVATAIGNFAYNSAFCNDTNRIS